MPGRATFWMLISLLVASVTLVACGAEETMSPATAVAGGPETISTPLPATATAAPTSTSTPMPTPTLAPLTLVAQELWTFDARIKTGMWNALVAQDQAELESLAGDLQQLRAELEAVQVTGDQAMQDVQQMGLGAIDSLIDMCHDVSLARLSGVSQAVEAYDAAWSKALPKVETPPADVSVPLGDGQLLFAVYQDEHWDIGLRSADSPELTMLTDDEDYDGDADWSPDGDRVAFVSTKGEVDDVYVMSADGTGLVNLTKDAAEDSNPGWSPDGSQIVFSAKTGSDGDWDLWVMKADGTEKTNLTQHDAYDNHPAWSPDGQHLAFTSDRDGDRDIYVMPIDGSAPTNLTDNESADFMAVWSPDGMRIAFVSDRDGNSEIYVMNADGSAPKNLTQNRASDHSPVWSPDGKWILFSSDRFFGYDVFGILADGTAGAVRLTDTRGQERPCDWAR
jgi:hypothetical protein